MRLILIMMIKNIRKIRKYNVESLKDVSKIVLLNLIQTQVQTKELQQKSAKKKLKNLYVIKMK